MSSKELKRYAIAVVGEGGVGKSAILNRFIYDQYAMEYDPTLEDSCRKQCAVDDEVVLIELVDSASQEDYRVTNYWANFIRPVDGVVLAYSVGSRFTFDGIRKLHGEVLQCKEQDSFPMVLVANKSDLTYDREVNLAEGEELAKEFGCYFFEASAKTGKNINEAFYELVREIKKSRKEQNTESKLPPDAKHDDVQYSYGCCNGCSIF